MWTDLSQPVRTMWARPRASLRSVFMVIAASAAFTWRVSRQTTGKPASISRPPIHSDVDPASRPARASADFQGSRAANEGLRRPIHLALPEKLAFLVHDANSKVANDTSSPANTRMPISFFKAISAQSIDDALSNLQEG